MVILIMVLWYYYCKILLHNGLIIASIAVKVYISTFARTRAPACVQTLDGVGVGGWRAGVRGGQPTLIVLFHCCLMYFSEDIAPNGERETETETERQAGRQKE